jgi:hypothetical protein
VHNGQRRRIFGKKEQHVIVVQPTGDRYSLSLVQGVLSANFLGQFKLKPWGNWLPWHQPNDGVKLVAQHPIGFSLSVEPIP